MTQATASQVCLKLGELPVAYANEAGTERQLSEMQGEVNNYILELADEKKAYASDVAANKVQIGALNAQIITLKRQSKLHTVESFFLGFVTGIMARGPSTGSVW